MDEIEFDSDESEWTPENLNQLFSAMKKSISNGDRNISYVKGLKNVDWATVAFPPFSASECKNKWMDIFRKLQKMRSLTELIVDAESSLMNPTHKHHLRPTQANTVSSTFMKENYAKLRKKNPEISSKELFPFFHQKFSELSNKEKAKYEEKALRSRQEYYKRSSEHRKQYFQTANCMREQSLDPTEKQQMAKTHQIKRAKRFHGEPKFPARSSNLVFIKKKMNQLRKEIPVVQERFSKVCRMWAALPKSQRNEYTIKCDAGKLKYENKLQHWFESRTPELQAMYLKRNPTKRKYLNIIEANCQQQQKPLFLPSDSEDEDIVCSSDEEEDDDDDDDDDDVVEFDMDEEREEQEESFIFEMY